MRALPAQTTKDKERLKELKRTRTAFEPPGFDAHFQIPPVYPHRAVQYSPGRAITCSVVKLQGVSHVTPEKMFRYNTNTSYMYGGNISVEDQGLVVGTVDAYPIRGSADMYDTICAPPGTRPHAPRSPQHILTSNIRHFQHQLEQPRLIGECHGNPRIPKMRSLPSRLASRNGRRVFCWIHRLFAPCFRRLLYEAHILWRLSWVSTSREDLSESASAPASSSDDVRMRGVFFRLLL